ncbi:MAG: B12-binding domain-containing radical SAM protein [Candidatus Helarchaeota archaeon]
MDILLINPATELSSKISYNREPPAGLLSIATYLRIHGLDVKVIDAQDTELLNLYLELEPIIVGITCLTNTFSDAIKISNQIKDILPTSKIVMGGPHATFMWKEILASYQTIDFVVIGEGEYSLLELYNNISTDYNKVKGIAFRNKNNIIYNGFSKNFDVNTFKYPDRINIIPNKYDVASIIVNRGCPFNCSFCVRQKLFGSVRIRDPHYIVEEMLNVEDLGYSFANLYDNINLKPEIALEICKLIEKNQIEIPWGAELRGDMLSFQLAKAMADAGCRVIAIGVESADENVLKLNGKIQSLEKTKNGIINAKNVGLAIQCYFVIGLPGETSETFESTINFIEDLPLTKGIDRIDFFIATPYPGSNLYENKENQFDINIIDTNWDHYDTEHVIFETNTLLYDDIKELFSFAKKYSIAFNKILNNI